MSRVVLIGQAPGPNTDPSEPLYPSPRTSAGGRLASFLGLSPDEYLATFDRFNLIEEFPGKANSKERNEDKFPLYEAKIAAAAMRPLLRERTVLLLGRRVALAWGGAVARTDFLQWTKCPRFGTWLAVVPHPSGRNPWYNDEHNRVALRLFWLMHVASLNGQAQPLTTGQEVFA